MENINLHCKKNFWCFICKKETDVKEINNQILCDLCKSDFVEEIESDTDREEQKKFQTINTNTINNPQPQNNNLPINTPNVSIQIITSMGGNIRTFSSHNHPNNLNFSLPFQNIINQVGNLFSFGNSSNFTLNSNNLSQFLFRHNNDQAFENLLNFLMMNDPNRHGTPPASKKIVSKLPRIKVGEDNYDIFLTINCLVCMDSYKKDEVTIKLFCNHYFHENCILEWLKLHNSCPVCRFELETDDTDYENKKNERRRILREYNQSNNN
jgi:E3 ubiquitin-protein ligase RNF115/126